MSYKIPTICGINMLPLPYCGFNGNHNNEIEIKDISNPLKILYTI